MKINMSDVRDVFFSDSLVSSDRSCRRKSVRRMRTQPKRRTIREGALPLLLSFLSLEISPPYLHPVPAALPTACGVRARLLHSLGALRCLRRARLLS